MSLVGVAGGVEGRGGDARAVGGRALQRDVVACGDELCRGPAEGGVAVVQKVDKGEFETDALGLGLVQVSFYIMTEG